MLFWPIFMLSQGLKPSRTTQGHAEGSEGLRDANGQAEAESEIAGESHH